MCFFGHRIRTLASENVTWFRRQPATGKPSHVGHPPKIGLEPNGGPLPQRRACPPSVARVCCSSFFLVPRKKCSKECGEMWTSICLSIFVQFVDSPLLALKGNYRTFHLLKVFFPPCWFERESITTGSILFFPRGLNQVEGTYLSSATPMAVDACREAFAEATDQVTASSQASCSAKLRGTC